MHLVWHFLITAALILFSILKYNVGLLEITLILIGGFLIDADHYLLYVLTEKRFGIREAYTYFSGEHSKPHLCVFHTLEFAVMMAFLALYFPILWWFLAGLGIHLVLDIIEDLLIRRVRAHPGRIYLMIPYLLWGKVVFRPGRTPKPRKKRARA